jgi:tetratricopeptide (TPR) repeat protein
MQGVLVLGAGLAAALCAAGLAMAQGAWTTVSKTDLQICAPVFGEVQRIELSYVSARIASVCTEGGAGFNAEDCASARDRLSKTQAKDPLDWFYDGNDACGAGTDYPCYGPSIYNTPRTGRDATVWTTSFVNDAAKPTHITTDMTLAQAVAEGDRCIAQVWVKKYRAAGGNAPPPVVAIAPPNRSTFDPAMCLDGGKGTPERLSACGKLLADLKPADGNYGPLAIAMMNMQIDAGNRAEALRYGELLAAGKSPADVAMTSCAVRVIAKWDLDAGLAACRSLGDFNSGALEAAGQIHLLAGRWQDAWNAFDASYRAGQAGQALYLRGMASAGLGRMGEALKDMADGEAKAPGSAQAYDRDGFSLAAVTQGKPLVPPEAFAPIAAPPPAPALIAQPAAVAPPPLPPATPQPVAVPSVVAPPVAESIAASPPPSLAPTAMPRFDPDGPRPPPPALSDIAMQTCENEIRALQAGSRTWQATIDEISLKLGMFQRTLYSSRCAGHTQAENQVASAERLILDAEPRAAAVVTVASQTSPAVTDCVETIPVGDTRNTTDMSIFRNTCAFPMMLTYCNVAPVTGSWAEAFACETRSSVALVNLPASGAASAVFGRQINYIACKAPALPVASYTPASGLSGYCK